jgi:hypothetical protein
MFCNQCGNEAPVDSRFCGTCGAGLSPATVAHREPQLGRDWNEGTSVSYKKPKQILQDEIAQYIGQGFTLGQQTDSSVELIKPKKYNFILTFFWFVVCFPFFFLFGVGFIVFILGFFTYSIYFAVGKKNLQVYITVTETGEIRKSEGKVAYYVKPVGYR